MDAPSDAKLHPAVALLNELDNLLAQLHSIELELKRAQATADDKIARLQEQVAQLDGVRRSNEEEIAALKHETRVQQRALTERQEAVTAVELALHSKIQSLQQDLARSRNELKAGDAAIESARRKSDAEPQESRAKAKDEELRAAQSNAIENEQRLGAKINELQLQLADRQLLTDSRAAEIVDLKAEVGRLTRRLAKVDSESKFQSLMSTQAKIHDAADETDTHERERPMKIDDVNKPTTQSTAEFEQSRASQQNSEQMLRDEIDRLRREAQEKNQILQDRNNELVRVKSEFDRLHERVNDLESATSRAERAYGGEAERVRTEFQAQVALLQAELSQKEWALEEQQAETRGREQNLRQEIDSLRRQVAESKTAKPHDPHDFVFGEPRPDPAQEQRFEVAGDAPTDQERNGFASHRRWNGGFGWKRRWRS
jgi:DNA repair exonuclease SbcCD ATPase subunit